MTGHRRRTSLVVALSLCVAISGGGVAAALTHSKAAAVQAGSSSAVVSPAGTTTTAAGTAAAGASGASGASDTSVAGTTSTSGVAVDAATFATGGCVSYAATGTPNGRTVYLDAGHGGPDSGGLGVTGDGTAIEEKTLTLAVVTKAVPLLQAAGFRVVVSRTTDSTVARLTAADYVSGVLGSGALTAAGEHADLAARSLCADEGKADYLLSVHFNVGSSAADAGILTTYDAERTFAAANSALATAVNSDVLAALNAKGYAIPDGGIVHDDTVGNAVTAADASYGHLLVLGAAQTGYFDTPSTMPGALVEPLFLSDPFEGSIADSAVGQETIAQGITAAFTSLASAAS